MKHSIGIDAHQRSCSIHVLDEEGKTLAEFKCATSHEELKNALMPYLPARIVLEATTVSERVARACEAAAKEAVQEVEVIVADPNYGPMYAYSTKTDKLDAKSLAMAARTGAYRVVHRKSEKAREVAAALEGRDLLVGERTELINHIRAKHVEHGLKTPSCDAEDFHKRVQIVGFSVIVEASLARLVKVLANLAVLIKEADSQLDELVEKEEVTKRFVKVPGIGPVTALWFFALVDDPTRFESAGAVANYFGVVPRENSSGEKRSLGHITKRGQPRMRNALFQAAGGVLRTKNPKATQMQQWGLRLYNKKNWGMACTAISRKLCGILYSMWRDGTPFDPTRSAQQLEKVYVLKSKKANANPAATEPSGRVRKITQTKPREGSIRVPPVVVRRTLRNQPQQTK